MPDQQKFVLVVDDDPGIRRMIVASLRREGYALAEAQNGREALEQMADHTRATDLVLLDLMMPEVSGWDVLRARASDPALRIIPVIVISANREPAVAEVMDKEICAFLPKPFDLTTLHSVVRGCLEAAHESGPHSPQIPPH